MATKLAASSARCAAAGAAAQQQHVLPSMLLKSAAGARLPRPFGKAVPHASAAARRRSPVLQAAVAQPLVQQEVVYEGRVDAVPEDEVPAGMFRSLDATEDLVQRLQNQCALLETLTKDAQGMRDKTAFFTSPTDNAIMKQHIHRTREQRKQDRLQRRAANLAQSLLTEEGQQQQQPGVQAGRSDSLRLKLEQVFSRNAEATSLEAAPEQQQQQTLSMDERRALRQQRKATRTQPATAVESSSSSQAAVAAAGPAAPSSSAAVGQADVHPPRRTARTAPASAPAAAAAAAAAAATLAALGGPASARAAPAATSSSAAAAPAPAAAAMSAATSATALSGAPATTALSWSAPAASSSGSSTALPARQSMARERAARRSGRHKVGATATVAPTAVAGAAASGARGLEGFGAAASTILESASGTPVLSKEEVNDLCRMVQDLLGLEELAKQLAQQLGRQPSMDEWAAAAGMGNTHRFQMRLEQGQRAKQMMVSSNLRLVASICRSYADAPGAVMQDLVAEGIAGLIRGVERFEPERGFRFSTYAHWWIRQGVNKAITEQGRAVRLPQHLHENVQKMQRTFAILSRQLGRKPTTSEVATALDWTVDKIQDLWELMKDPSSLEQPSFDEPGAGTLGDTIEDERMLTAEDQAVVENMKSDLEQVLLQLNPREAGVVRLRFGLKDGHERTLEEVGTVFGVTRERVRQIEARALRLLRAHQASLSGMEEYSEEKKKVAARNSKGTKKSK